MMRTSKWAKLQFFPPLPPMLRCAVRTNPPPNTIIPRPNLHALEQNHCTLTTSIFSRWLSEEPEARRDAELKVMQKKKIDRNRRNTSVRPCKQNAEIFKTF
jgi:hypothetical protein